MLAECCGGVPGYALLAADVLIIVLRITVGRPTLEVGVAFGRSGPVLLPA